MKKLGYEFYEREDVCLIARDLIGKVLITKIDGHRSGGRIVETEAYNGVIDRASHAYGDRKTRRTGIMYQKGGTAYVYLCYGIHFLFNVVTNKPGIPHAVLVRAIEPVKGVPYILERTGYDAVHPNLGSGPGRVSQALGINAAHNGMSLLSNEIFLMDDGFSVEPGIIIQTPRIGVDYAGEDAILPYRFYLKNNPHVSAKNKFKGYAMS